MKPDCEELNRMQQEENEKQVEADFQDFIKLGLPLIIGIIIIAVFVFTYLLNP